MTISADPDQMPHFAASDLGLQCLQRPICPNRVIMVDPDQMPHFVESHLDVYCLL